MKSQYKMRQVTFSLKPKKQLDREKRIIGYEWYFNTFPNF